MDNGMLLVLAAPSVSNTYYQEHFEEIVDFQVNYARTIIDTGNDEVLILVDSESRQYYAGEVSDDILIEAEMYDIWMRDFTTVNPYDPVQFVYTDASMSLEDSMITQDLFNGFADGLNIKRKQTKYILDGGNIVDNYKGKVITTTRFLEDNNLAYEEGKSALKDVLGATHVAILEPDDDVLAHADGMVAWIDDNVLLVNDYSQTDEEYHEAVMDELERAFPDITILTVPVMFDDGGIDTTKGIGSACGIHINLVYTDSTLYVPVFGNEYEQEVLRIIQNNTSKEVVTVDAQNICRFGGSVRCMTWQLSSKAAGNLLP